MTSDPKRVYVLTPIPILDPDTDYELHPADSHEDYVAACERARWMLEMLMDATEDEPKFSLTVELRDATDEDRESLRGDDDQ